MKAKGLLYFGVTFLIFGLLGCRSVNKTDPSRKYPLLHSLQGVINTSDPKELLDILVAKVPSRENPRDIFPWERLAVPLKHEALMRLLEMQVSYFHAKPFKADNRGVGVDNIAVWVKDGPSDMLEVVATPTWNPIRQDAAGAKYYVLETFEFDRTGRLVSRSAYLERPDIPHQQ